MSDEQELAAKVIRLISRGRLDDQLTEINEAVIHRTRNVRAYQAYEQVMRVEPGDRVKIKQLIRPKYLAGRRGTVIQVSSRTRAGVPMVEVELDSPVGKYTNGKLLLHGSSFEITSKGEIKVSPDNVITLR